MNNYFERISKKLDELSDEEFDRLLTRAGIENCPYEPDESIKQYSEKYNEFFKFDLDYVKKPKIKFTFDRDSLTNFTERKNVA